jgi:ATP-dependent Clp protease ATP-binding subunit ClpC
VAGAEEAIALSHDWLGPEHLMLGFLRDEESLAARILREHGLTLESLRARLAREWGS